MRKTLENQAFSESRRSIAARGRFKKRQNRWAGRRHRGASLAFQHTRRLSAAFEVRRFHSRRSSERSREQAKKGRRCSPARQFAGTPICQCGCWLLSCGGVVLVLSGVVDGVEVFGVPVAGTAMQHLSLSPLRENPY